MAVSQDSLTPILVSGAANNCVLVWDLLTLTIMHTLQDPLLDTEAGLVHEVASVAIADGLHPIIVTTCWDKSIRVWDSKTGALLRILEGHLKAVHCVITGCDINGPIIASSGADISIRVWSVEADLMDAVASLQDVDRVELEDSLVVVGKFLVYWKFVLKGDIKSKPFNLAPSKAGLVFYCMLRAGRLNPKLVRTNVSALNALMQHAIEDFDLLKFDAYLGCTPIQFLLENRLCVGRAQDWIRTAGNMRRVIHFLSDPLQTSQTLDSILSAVIGEEESGWKELIPDPGFGQIFRNLILHSPRSHQKIVSFLRLQVSCHSYQFTCNRYTHKYFHHLAGIRGGK